ncbi:hypothetical protein GCM10017673_46170 [Streptosporangium violaceochromogenes]|nr:hypothetical protein GCM10017673_46170 [Streptosporangium violaceochromogenes]
MEATVPSKPPHASPAGAGRRPRPGATGDVVIRALTTLVVVLLAAVAAVVSYRHILEVVREHGESGWVAHLVPLCIDGLLVAASLTLLDAARRDLTRHWLSWAALAAGIVLTLSANILHGWKYGAIGAVIAALPAVTLTISFELLMVLIRRGAVLVPSPAGAVAARRLAERPAGAAGRDTAAAGKAAPSPAPPPFRSPAASPAASPAPPAQAPAPAAVPVPDALFPVAAERFAEVLSEGRLPALKRIREELRVGQPRAARIRAYLGQLAES